MERFQHCSLPIDRFLGLISPASEDSRIRWSEHESSLCLVPGTREPLTAQIRGERREPARNLIMPLEMETLHQCGTIEPLARMIDQEIE